MSTIQEIEAAVQKLPSRDLAVFRAWFEAFDAAGWDRDLAGDIAAGRLDPLADEALRDLRDGRGKDL